MAKFGKKVKVSTDLSSYILGILSPSGWGKSTLMYEVCERLFGGDGYICADFGQEDGYAAIAGANVEQCTNWKHFVEMVDDIVKNKDTDYKNLKVVVWDTMDFAFDECEEYTVKAYNREHMGEQSFRPAKSINGVEGFGKGLDLVIANVRKQISRLSDVGVGTWFAAHVKEREQVDLMSGNNFTQITCAMTNRYYASIKNIAHCIGVGYYARTMNTVEVGSENAVTHKKKTRNAMMEEERRIVFRDTAFLCDSKSRFPDIEADIVLDPDEFIRVITEAVEKAAGVKKTTAASKKPTPNKSTKKSTVEEKPIPEDITIPEDIKYDIETHAGDEMYGVDESVYNHDESEPEDIFDEELDEEPIEEEPSPVDKATLDAIRASFKSANADTKAQVKVILANYGGRLVAEMRPADVEKIKAVLGI